MKRATGASVRKILCASATRIRNLSVLTMASVSSLVLVGLGMSWYGLAMLGAGIAAYATLIGTDAVSDKFLSELFCLGEETPEDGEEPAPRPELEAPLDLSELSDELRRAYKAILARRSQMQELLAAGPPVLQASLPEGRRICDSLLASARRLTQRGRRLHKYLLRTKLTDLSNSACEAVLQVEASNDQVAARTYRLIVLSRQRHMETHIEVEGLYDRVLSQLVLIETTLAGAVAKIVKITAADDEESSLTTTLVNEQLESLMSDVRILETSLDEVSQARAEEVSQPSP